MATEKHHIAGRAYSDDVIELCIRCHREVSRWQRSAGIDLRSRTTITELERIRAILIGYALIAELACRIYGRQISKAMDLGNSESWTPNPTTRRSGRD